MTTSPNRDVWSPDVPVEENPYYWTDDPVITRLSAADGPQPSVVELFCGLGGFSQGFVRAGFSLLLGADIHRPSIESLGINHPEAGRILGDLRKVTSRQLKSALCNRQPDVMLAGVPCQGFSLSNRKRHADDARNQLFRDFIRLAKAQSPRAVVIENVSGMRSAAGGEFVSAIRAEIESQLKMETHVVFLNASHFGVPQTRERLFFVGLPKGAKWTAPTPTHGPGTRRAIATVRDAIADLPPLGSGESCEKYGKAPRSLLARELRGSQLVLLNHEAPSHPLETIERIRRTVPGQPMYDSFRQRIRLEWDSPSPTQLSGGIRPQFQFGHPSQPRGLTIRERCRIQTFSDETWVAGGLTQGRVQTGNAVPPFLAMQIALALRSALNI